MTQAGFPKKNGTFTVQFRQSANMIIGHRTYDILTKQPEFAELENVKIAVVSHKNFQTLNKKHFVAKSPQEALNIFTDCKEVVVAGGSILNAGFMREKLIDELYLDIEPLLVGKGIPLFAQEDFEARLELIEVKKLTKNELQLHCKVVKNSAT